MAWVSGHDAVQVADYGDLTASGTPGQRWRSAPTIDRGCLMFSIMCFYLHLNLLSSGTIVLTQLGVGCRPEDTMPLIDCESVYPRQKADIWITQ